MNRLRSNPWVVLLVLCLGFFVILLDTTIVNIAIPSIIDGLGASLDQILWVLNAYMLVYAVLLITAGRLGDLFGQRNMFALGMVIFVVASAFCGLATDVNQLIIGRVVQGVGGALLSPQTLAILTTIFPPRQRGAAFGIWGAVGGIAAIAGPTLGGLIVSGLTWHWIFFVNLPIGVIAVAAAFLLVPDLRPGRQHRLDLVGVALASVGLFSLVFALIEGERFNWGAIWGWLTIPELLVFGALVIVAFTLWERAQSEPLVPFSIFEDRNFTIMNWMSAVVAFSMTGFFLPMTIYLQSGLNMTALQAGLTMAPASLVAMFVAPMSGRLSDKIGGKYILMIGMLLFAGGCTAVAFTATPQSTWQDFLFPLIVAGVGQGCVFAPMSTIAMQNVSPRVAGAASGVFDTTRQVGGVVGGAVIGAVLQMALADNLHSQAVARAAQLPAQMQQMFIDAFANVAQSGLFVGQGQQGTGQLPAGLPPAVAQQIERIAHEVFVNGFIGAMRPTVSVAAALIVIGAITCLGIANRGRPHEHIQARNRAAASDTANS